MKNNIIKVLLVDDHQIFREGVKSLLSSRADVQVIGESDDGFDAIQKAKDLNPDIIVMDISLKNLNGIEASSKILLEIPTAKIIFLSMHSNLKYVTQALKVGGKGYLPKDCAYNELVDAIYKVHKGERYLSSPIADQITDEFLQNSTIESSELLISANERQVLQLLAKGKSSLEIADMMCLSKKTVQSYRHNLMRKIGVHNVSGLIHYAIKEGIISAEE